MNDLREARRAAAVEVARLIVLRMHTPPAEVDFDTVALEWAMGEFDLVTLSTIRATGRLMMEAVDDERERRGDQSRAS